MIESVYLGILVGISLFVVNKVFINKYLPLIRLNLYLLFKGEKSTGNVTGYESRLSVQGHTEFRAEIQFVDKNNIEKKFFTDFDFTTQPIIGNKARVVYDPLNSSNAIFLKRGLAVFTIFIIIFFLSVNFIIINFYFRWI
ncbi:MAG: hypothetical protein ACK54A_01605 [Sphingobacteriales bacterium]|jgi:hypothetical protein